MTDLNLPPTHTIRAVTGGRTTTFLGLRIVYKEGHNSLGSDAIWPLAIIERPEYRGPFRFFTQALRKQLAHVQAHGVLLPAEYVSLLNSPPAPPPSSPARPVLPNEEEPGSSASSSSSSCSSIRSKYGLTQERGNRDNTAKFLKTAKQRKERLLERRKRAKEGKKQKHARGIPLQFYSISVLSIFIYLYLSICIDVCIVLYNNVYMCV